MTFVSIDELSVAEMEIVMLNEREVPRSVDRSEQGAWRSFALAVIGLSLFITTGAGVFATLSATANNLTPEEVDSGTLELTLSDNGDGFSQAISNLAPGDVVNRFINLTNSGSLAGRNLMFSTTTTGTPSLITDGVTPIATRALQVSVSSCSVAWTPGTGVCDGTTTELLSPLPLSIAEIPQMLLERTVDVAEVTFLRVSIALPDQSETTVNGIRPAHSVQGGAVDITFTFIESQRSAETIDS